MKKFKEYLAAIPEQVTVTRMEGILIVTICALAGVIIGMLCSPRKNVKVKIGSENSAINSGLGAWNDESQNNDAEAIEENSKQPKNCRK